MSWSVGSGYDTVRVCVCVCVHAILQVVVRCTAEEELSLIHTLSCKVKIRYSDGTLVFYICLFFNGCVDGGCPLQVF